MSMPSSDASASPPGRDLTRRARSHSSAEDVLHQPDQIGVVVHQQDPGQTRAQPCAGAASRAEAHPGELFPSGLAAPGVPQPAQPPVERELAVAEVLQHRIGKQDQDLAPPAERQQMALQPVGQAVAEAPGADQHGEDVHQNPVAQRGEQEGPQSMGS